MKKRLLALVASAFVGFVASNAQAGFLTASFGTPLEDLNVGSVEWRVPGVVPWTSAPAYNYQTLGSSPALSLAARVGLTLTSSGGGDLPFSGSIDKDPPVQLVFPVVNNSLDTWQGLTFTITANTNTVLSAPVSGVSDVFGNAVVNGNASQYTLAFNNGASLAPGGTANFTLNFNVDVTSFQVIGGTGTQIGLFNYTIGAVAVVPEPASAGLLGIGGLVLLGRRRA